MDRLAIQRFSCGECRPHTCIARARAQVSHDAEHGPPLVIRHAKVDHVLACRRINDPIVDHCPCIQVACLEPIQHLLRVVARCDTLLRVVARCDTLEWRVFQYT